MTAIEMESEGEEEGVAEPEDLSAMLDEYYGDVEAEEHGDQGDDQYLAINVLRMVMSTFPTTEEEQRENLFHISCRVQGSRCVLIIDGGSCTNVVAASLVEKLKLATTPHPKPYKLHWLSDQGSLHVTQRARVPFSVGDRYQDEVICDILPMCASHILLGRPWLFDRKVLHDGYRNTYVFQKDGKKVVLTPMSPTEVQEVQKQISRGIKKKSMFMGKKELEEAIHEEEPLFLLQLRHVLEAKKKLQVPVVISQLIEEYVDVFPEELPKGLPP